LAVLVRGDHQLSEVKLAIALGGRPWRFADARQIEEWTGGPMGFSGPVGLAGLEVLADLSAARALNAVVGANRKDTHLRNANPGRDFPVVRAADLRVAREGEPCPACEAPTALLRGIEVGHVFKLGTTYSEPMRATFLDEQGRERPYVMGCYGLGIGRTVAAAIEQNHDADGIIWPLPLAPFEVLVTVVNADDPALLEAASHLAADLESRGVEVLLDDRNERAGVKFKDGDLIGLPLRAVFGSRSFQEGKVELSLRRTRERLLVPRDEAASRLLALREELARGAPA
jgi:prolyl-tRNA synthetase